MDFLTKNLFGGSYDDLWKAVIRPPRDTYKESDLGPLKFILNNKTYQRSDITLKNKRDHAIKCSFWEPIDQERVCERLPCVIYLHGNSSSRAEAVQEIKILLPMGITLFAFDFAGCGKSEGEFISLGYYEQDDVLIAIEYLRKMVISKYYFRIKLQQ